MAGDVQFLTNPDGSIPSDLNSLPATSLGQFAKNAVDRNTRALLVKPVGGSEAPVGASFTDRSGTIASGGASQQVAPANASRKYFVFQNHSDTDMWINFGVAAVAGQPSIKIFANGGAYEPLVPPTAAINVICASTGKAFTSKEA